MAVTLEEVTKLYVATFNRAPDAAGIDYWVNSGMPIEDIAQSFFDQSETQILYPSETSNATFVNSVYRNLFNRDAEQAGLDYWMNELDSGRVAKQNFILAAINGALDTEISLDSTILTNKQTVGLDFVAKGLESVDFARSVMKNVDATTNSVQSAIEMIDKVVAPTGEITQEMLSGLNFYHYDTDITNENFAQGYDALWKSTFGLDGTYIGERYIAPFGSSDWVLVETEILPYALVNGRILIQSTNENDIWSDTLTLVSHNSSYVTLYDHSTSTDTNGTADTSDDTIQETDEFFTWMLVEPSARTEETIYNAGDVLGVTFVDGGSYYAGDGVSSEGGVDYEVNVTALNANVAVMLGSVLDNAFIINIHDTTANQTIVGTNVNDVFNWRGGNDIFDGAGDGGDAYNGGSDFVSLNINPSTSIVSIDTSVVNTIIFKDNNSAIVTIIKNQDGSFDVQTSNSDTLHMIDIEVFRLYTVPQDGSQPFNIDVDLLGTQTGVFDVLF